VLALGAPKHIGFYMRLHHVSELQGRRGSMGQLNRHGANHAPSTTLRLGTVHGRYIVNGHACTLLAGDAANVRSPARQLSEQGISRYSSPISCHCGSIPPHCLGTWMRASLRLTLNAAIRLQKQEPPQRPRQPHHDPGASYTVFCCGISCGTACATAGVCSPAGAS
jgi:hypothetical protein